MNTISNFLIGVLLGIALGGILTLSIVNLKTNKLQKTIYDLEYKITKLSRTHK